MTMDSRELVKLLFIIRIKYPEVYRNLVALIKNIAIK